MGLIERVKEFRPELQSTFFHEVEVLVKSEVAIESAWRGENVSSQRSVLAGLIVREGTLVQISRDLLSSRAVTGEIWIRHKVRPVRSNCGE